MNRLANDIIKKIQVEEKHRINFWQFNNCNAYIGETVNVVIGNNDYNVIPIKSYQTIVAYVDIDTLEYIEVGKYSRTTSKQVTQIYNQHFSNYKRLYEEKQDYYTGI